MGFAGGPVSFQRFFITGRAPKEIDDAFVAAVAQRAFGRSPVLPDDTQVGWVGPRHVLDTEIAAPSIAYGAFANLALRIDTLRVPGNVLKAYVQLEEHAVRQAGGHDFLNRGQRRKAREAALLRASQEARDGGFRRMNSYPLLIDLEHKVAYLGTLGATVADKLMSLFHDTFGCSLEPANPESVAGRIVDRAGDARALESLTPFNLVKPPAGFGTAAPDFAGADLSFLGKEFLTWLWFQIDADEGPLKLTAGDDVTVTIDKTLRLKCDFNLTGTDVITADGPASLPEARAALQIGKQPTRMGLVVGAPAGEFRFTLDGPRWTISGLTLPESESETDFRARLEQRFELIGDVANLLDALFELYVNRRIGRNWNRELRSMSAWAAGATLAPARPAATA